MQPWLNAKNPLRRERWLSIARTSRASSMESERWTMCPWPWRPGISMGLWGATARANRRCLKLIAGYLAPTDGTVAVCGEALASLPDERAHLGCLIEHPAVNPALSRVSRT